MIPSQQILKLAKANNGVITTAMIANAGLPRGSLKYLSDKGILERVARGVYTLPEVWEDEFVNIQCRYKRGIYSLDACSFSSDPVSARMTAVTLKLLSSVPNT